ncbi:CDP-diacylglycerol--glycerol-3-phosphate 3-phosphatidyltransferase [bacterium]|nr:CDP-diacylglycerol--glycerol-3-phosphate 3-phosphatidyltransferase [bacterium]MBU1653221.1 CDP-diacylglycerol--glycerol-3-phosphate 3-phosphatidyltransferase [bacterium]
MLLTLPNMLTGLRLLLVPIILVLFFADSLVLQMLATLLFIIAAITDHIDGRMARKHNLVSQFGKFADPLADKALTLSVFAALVMRDEFAGIATYLAIWVALIAIREIGITGLRFWAVWRGTPVITSGWGKAKTTAQLTTLIFTMVVLNYRQLTMQFPQIGALYPGDAALRIIVHVLVIICMIVTVISGLLYLSSNRFEAKKNTA